MFDGEATAPSDDRRAQSEVLGFALLIGMTVLGASAVVAVGGDLVETTQSRVTLDGAELAMTELDSRVGLVGLGQTESKRVSLPGSDRGSTYVDGDAGRLRVTITNRSSGAAVMNETVTLGAVIYRQEGGTIAYQGGGVWRVADGGEARMVSPPEFHYRLKRGGEPTLTLPIVSVSGAGSAESFTATSRGTDVLFPDRTNSTLSNPLESGRVDITIRSDYYRAWGSYLEARTSGEVRYDDARRSVTLTLVSPREPRTLDQAIASGSEDAAISGGATVDSYNSSNGTYAGESSCPPGARADVYVGKERLEEEDDGVLEVRGDSIVCGNMTVDGSLHVGGGMTVRGDLVVNGDLSFGGGVDTFDADRIIATGTLDVGGGSTLSSDATVGGSVTTGGGVTVAANVTTGGEYAGPTPDDGYTVVEGASASQLSGLERARDLDPPNLEPIDGEIAAALAGAKNASDDDEEIGEIESGSCGYEKDGNGCTLTSGEYYLEDVNVGGDLEINTTDGPVTLAVADDLSIGSGGIRVTGDDPVRVYVGDDVSVGGGGTLATANGRGDQVVVYGGSDSTYTLGGGSTVHAVLYAPGNDDVTIRGGSEVFGAVVGTISTVTGDSAVHYDDALAGRAAIDDGGGGFPHLAYIHVSVNRVEIEPASD